MGWVQKDMEEESAPLIPGQRAQVTRWHSLLHPPGEEYRPARSDKRLSGTE